MKSIIEQLREYRRAKPDAVLLIARDRPYTRAEVDDQSSLVASRLLAEGLAPGDRVAIHLANSIEIVIAYYACFKAGLIAVPINTRFAAAEIAYVVGHSEARAYIGQPDLFVHAAKATAQVPLRYMVGNDAQGLLSFNDLLAPGSPAAAMPVIDLDAPTVVLYTSGTTARPKGVIHTRRSLAATTAASADAFFQKTDRISIVLPMVHIAALSAFFTAVLLEIIPVVLPFEPSAVLDAVEKHEITILTAMPALFRMLADTQAAKPRRISSIRACLVGGDSAPAALHEQCREVFGAPLLEVYGLTEAVPLTYNTLVERRPGSMGKKITHAEIRLVADDGSEVPRGEVGQLTARSPIACTGYWNDPEATAAAIKDGWFHTGDLARQDDEGFYWFAGRSKEIIIRGGSNVSPQEVEEALYQHPAVAEVAVVGKPDEQWGEILVAFIALKPGSSLNADELTAFASERIAKYKVPEVIIFEPTLPKGPTGKVARRPLRERLL